MRSMVRRFGAAMLVVSTALTLTGCIPLPISPNGYLPGSRSNLPDRQPGFIVPGQTTRAEVLLQLGSPDSEADDQSWFAYSSLRDAGGDTLINPFLVTVANFEMVERQLNIRFDSNSVVKQAGFREVACQFGFIFDTTLRGTGRCLPLGDTQYDSTDASIQSEVEPALATAENSFFTVSLPGGGVASVRMFRGRLTLTQRALLLEAKSSVSLDTPPLPRLRIPYKSMTELRRDSESPHMKLYTRSGYVYTITVNVSPTVPSLFERIPNSAENERFIAELQALSGLTLRGP